MMKRHFALVACVLLACAALPSLADPLSDLHSLAAAAPRADDVIRADSLVEIAVEQQTAQERAVAMQQLAEAEAQLAAIDRAMAEATAEPEPAAFTEMAAETETKAETEVATETAVDAEAETESAAEQMPALPVLAAADAELSMIHQQSGELAAQKAAVEQQRSTIQKEESRLQRLRRVIAENKEILMRNEKALQGSSTRYLRAVKSYTQSVNEQVAESLRATQAAAEAQVAETIGAEPEAEAEAEPEGEAPVADATAPAEEPTADESMPAPRSMLSLGADAEVDMEADAEFQAQVAARMRDISREFARDYNTHQAAIPRTHSAALEAFQHRLEAARSEEDERAVQLAQQLHVRVPVASAMAPPLKAVEEVKLEMADEPVATFFIEVATEVDADTEAEQQAEADAESEAAAEASVESFLSAAAEVDAETTAEAEAEAAAAPAAAAAAPKLTKPTIEEGTVGLPVVSLMEIAAESEVEAEVEAELDADAEMDTELDAELSAETEADAEAEADAESESELSVSACAANTVRDAVFKAVAKQHMTYRSNWVMYPLKYAETLTRAAQVQANAKFEGGAFSELINADNINYLAGYAHIVKNPTKKTAAAIAAESVKAWEKAQYSPLPWPLANSGDAHFMGVGYAVVGGKGYVGVYITDRPSKAIGKAKSVKC